MTRLDYEPIRPPARVLRPIAAIWGIALGTLVTLPLLFVAYMATGAGHGSYGPAIMFFPYAMALTWFTQSITPICFVVACVQWPAYGAALFGIRLRRSAALVPVIVFVIHVLVFIVASRNDNFR